MKCPDCGSDNLKKGFLNLWCKDCGYFQIDERPFESLVKAFEPMARTADVIIRSMVQVAKVLREVEEMHDPLSVVFDVFGVVVWHRDPNHKDCYRLFHAGATKLHPKWHFWHWEIQVPIVLELKRWVWSRCARCGERFAWRETPCSHQWEGTGPRWFRGEPKIYHYRCLHKAAQARVQNVPGVEVAGDKTKGKRKP